VKVRETWRRYFSDQAHWDESHIQPVVEYIHDGMTPDAAYAELRATLADPDTQRDWIQQNADAIEEEGAPSGDEAYKVWADAYLRASKDRTYRQNPGDAAESDAALEKYLEFHRYNAKHLDTVDITIPSVVYKGGKATWVTYRSGKVDPSTLRRPKKPVDYIHEFNAGVDLYRADPGDGRERVSVPSEFRHVGALIKLGMCLGFSYKGPDGAVEGSSSRPLPELACCVDASGDSKCLYVIQDRRKVLAMIWGGALGVFARGIDG